MTDATLASASPSGPVDTDALMGDVSLSLYREWNERLDRSRALTARWRDLETELQNACMDAARNDWDGYGANAVNRGSVTCALELLKLLPVTFPAPSISVDADGEISLTWYGRPGSLLSISVSDTGQLVFAGVFGNARVRGREIFNNLFPAGLLPHLRRLFDYRGSFAFA